MAKDKQINAQTKKRLEEFIKILYTNKGHIAKTCDAVKIGRTTYYLWCDKYPSFKSDVDSVFERLVDDVESKLLANIQILDVPSIKFFLQSKAKSRGYGEVPQVGVVGNLKILWENEAVVKTPKIPKAKKNES